MIAVVPRWRWLVPVDQPNRFPCITVTQRLIRKPQIGRVQQRFALLTRLERFL
jgi:hypothetical protein